MFIILGTFTSKEVVTLYIVQEMLNITMKSRILQTEKAQRGFILFFLLQSFFSLSSSHYFAALRTPRLTLDSRGWRYYKRYVSDNFASSPPSRPHSLSRTRESPAISHLRIVNVINNYIARAAWPAWRDGDDHPPQCTLFWSDSSPTTLTHIHIYTYID